MKDMKTKEIIKTEQFIREPVDFFSHKMSKNTSKKIIINGGRGIGKSLILLNTQDRGLGTENQTICMNFGSIIQFSSIPNELFDEKFLNHYYELLFSFKILSYIKSNYALTYESNFKDYESLLTDISKNTNEYINQIYYEKQELQRYLFFGEVSSEIIYKLKKYLGLQTLTLAIDRFDWVNGSNAYTQMILSKYFDMFDKTVLILDDESLNNDLKKNELENKGYSFISPQYGRNVEVIKQIIKKRIQLYNEVSKKNFDERLLTDEIYRRLVHQANGNISLMLDTLGEVLMTLDWNDGYVENLEHEFDSEMNCQLNKVRQLRKMDANPPKFYL